MGTAGRFRRFVVNISATSDELSNANRRAQSAARALFSNYYPGDYDSTKCVVIGSYGKGTEVRPARDVDTLFLLPNSVFTRFNAHAGNGQSALLQEVRAIMQRRYPTTDRIRGDGQVVVIEFLDGHKVEVLPAWRSKDRYVIPDTHDGGSWKWADHDAEIEYVASSDAKTNGKTRDLIKMLKTWQSNCSVPIKSLTLELRAVNFLKTWPHRNEAFLYYDWMVRDFFEELIKFESGHCKIPGIDENCEYGDAWLSRAESAYARAAKACEYESEDKNNKATAEWCKIFGEQYDC